MYLTYLPNAFDADMPAATNGPSSLTRSMLYIIRMSGYPRHSSTSSPRSRASFPQPRFSHRALALRFTSQSPRRALATDPFAVLC